MRTVLSASGSRGDAEPLVALAVRSAELGAAARVCAAPAETSEERPAGAGVPLVPVGRSARAPTTAAPAPSSPPRRAADVIAARFETIPAVAEGGDMPAAAGRLGVRCVPVTFQRLTLPSPHRRPPVSHVRDHVTGDRPWPATDPLLDPRRGAPGLDAVRTGAWTVPDERPLPERMEAFLDAGAPQLHVVFGSMPLHAPQDVARAAVEAVRAHGRRVLLARRRAGLGPEDDRDDCPVVGEAHREALWRAGGRRRAPRRRGPHGRAGTTTAAARAGAPQVVVVQAADRTYRAGRVTESGIGAAHDGPVPAAGSPAAALATALAPATRARAAEAARAVRADGAAVATRPLSGTAGR
ncbi:glycosyltransferase [Streptomyces sp. NPDC006193]|uniref:nucleotide disphospho-sugar-binding domain-containing protein n=1 Tax=Streptomyces sp. NPDC006193 TaxID=3155717 RepID=UPI0033B9110B